MEMLLLKKQHKFSKNEKKRKELSEKIEQIRNKVRGVQLAI